MSGARGVAAVLLGTGVVGSALLEQLGAPAARSIRLLAVARSGSQLVDAGGLDPAQALARLAAGGGARDDAALLAALDASDAPVRVLIDATASADVATRHAGWLDAGYHVVTANKLAAGDGLAGWRALRAARDGGAHYGDAATVGAGLPVLSSLRRLLACGDQLISLQGVFSGSLSWLFNGFDGRRPFSELLAEAREAGYTEPDPRDDLSGRDAARKLLILARAAGHGMALEDIEVENLVPPALRGGDASAFLDRVATLDEGFEVRRAAAAARGHVLRYLARLDADGRATVGLCDVDPHHPAAALTGTDNQFVLSTRRYDVRPLVIAGPGAGPAVTAQALLADIFECRPLDVLRVAA